MNETANRARYGKQKPRPAVTPPLVTLKALRMVAGLTIDQLIAKLEVVADRKYTRGAISAIEIGTRGASDDLLRNLERAYGIEAGAITTTYPTRAARERAA